MESLEDKRIGWLSAGWKRGAFVRLDANRELLKELPPKLQDSIAEKDTVCIVPILYDCALVEECFEKEPWAQVLVVWKTTLDGNFSHAKNPRRLHIEAVYEGEPVFFEINALSFAQIDRERLLEATPDKNLSWSKGALPMLLDWVAERYRQATFPDNFNQRLYPSKRLLDKVYKDQLFCDYSSGIYIRLDTFDELSEDMDYNIDIYIVIPFNVQGKEYRDFKKANEDSMITMLKSAISTAPKIKLHKIAVIPESEFTKNLERDFHRFTLENFSYKSKGKESALPAEYLSVKM